MTQRSAWYSIRGSLWFVPGLLFLFSVFAALGLVQVDTWLDVRELARVPKAFSAGPEGARQILSVIASSTITIAGVIFSVTIVTLSLAAAQYSPRVLRGFMRDRLNQSVLGILVSVFIYSLLVLRAIRSEEQVFVPQIALWFGILFALVAIGFFIAFIHNSAVSIQAPEIVSRIANESLSALKAVGETSHEDGSSEMRDTAPSDEQLEGIQWQSIPSRKSGYVQDVDIHALFDLATRHNILLRVERPVGDFTVAGRPLVSVGGCMEINKKLAHQVQQQFGINSYRTVDKDPAFGVRQLVDIALKALSPSSNDTTTAIHCLDYLGVILHQAIQGGPLPQIHLQRGNIRLILRQPETPHLIDLAFNEIRQSAGGNVAVLLRMFRVARQLREDSQDSRLQALLLKHIHLIGENIDRDVPCSADREVLKQAARRAIATRPSV